MVNNILCPVCGYPGLSEEPRGGNGGGSYEICPCCGFEFGVTDDDQGFTYEEWRHQWVMGGMLWWAANTKPPLGWNPAVQVQGVSRG